MAGQADPPLDHTAGVGQELGNADGRQTRRNVGRAAAACGVPKRIWPVGGPVGTALKRGRGQDRLSGSLLLRVDGALKVAHEPRTRIVLPPPQKQRCRLEGEGRLKTR